jgi:formylglycine-generating enzyme required for sulfatase activity
VAKASNHNLQFFFAVSLIGCAAMAGIYRARQGSQVFSTPLFERSAPTVIVTADSTEGADKAVRSAISNRSEPDAGTTDIAFRPLVLAQTMTRLIEGNARLSDDSKRQLRTLFATPAQIAANGLSQDSAEARAMILQTLDRNTRMRVGENLLIDAPTLLAMLASVESPLAGRIRTRINAALARDEKISRALALLESLPLSEERIALASGNVQSVLKLEPNNARALRALDVLEQQICASANQFVTQMEFPQALSLLAIGEARVQTGSLIRQTRANVYLSQARSEAQLLDQFNRALNQQKWPDAERSLTTLSHFLPDARINPLRAQLQNTRDYGGFERGQSFRDRANDSGLILPEMRVIPIGRFVMGTPVNEKGRTGSEGPQREIEIARGFAMSIAEISVGEFAQFVQARNYQTEAERLGSSLIYDRQTGRLVSMDGIHWRHDYAGALAHDGLPVIHVSFQDALAYIYWLSELTGKRYRLPSEGEFEYVLRAGSTNRFPWGNGAPKQRLENLTGEQDTSETGRTWNAGFSDYEDGFWGAAPTRSFTASAFGIFDMGGNVSEWVQDCWHDSYTRAPVDARAWENPGCAERVVRGGSWGSAPDETRSGARSAARPLVRSPKIGFRIARDL